MTPQAQSQSGPAPTPAPAPPAAAALSLAVEHLSRALSAIAIYPAGHPMVVEALERALRALQQAGGGKDKITLGVARDQLWHGRAQLPQGESVRTLARWLHGLEVAAVSFTPGLSATHLRQALEAMAKARTTGLTRPRRGEELRQAIVQQGITRLAIQPIDYSAIRLKEGAAAPKAPPTPAARSASTAQPAPPVPAPVPPPAQAPWPALAEMVLGGPADGPDDDLRQLAQRLTAAATPPPKPGALGTPGSPGTPGAPGTDPGARASPPAQSTAPEIAGEDPRAPGVAPGAPGSPSAEDAEPDDRAQMVAALQDIQAQVQVVLDQVRTQEAPVQAGVLRRLRVFVAALSPGLRTALIRSVPADGPWSLLLGSGSAVEEQAIDQVITALRSVDHAQHAPPEETVRLLRKLGQVASAAGTPEAPGTAGAGDQPGAAKAPDAALDLAIPAPRPDPAAPEANHEVEAATRELFSAEKHRTYARGDYQAHLASLSAEALSQAGAALGPHLVDPRLPLANRLHAAEIALHTAPAPADANRGRSPFDYLVGEVEFLLGQQCYELLARSIAAATSAAAAPPNESAGAQPAGDPAANRYLQEFARPQWITQVLAVISAKAPVDVYALTVLRAGGPAALELALGEVPAVADPTCRRTLEQFIAQSPLADRVALMRRLGPPQQEQARLLLRLASSSRPDTEALVAALLEHADAQVRFHAYWALSLTNRPWSIEHLRRALAESYQSVRDMALDQLTPGVTDPGARASPPAQSTAATDAGEDTRAPGSAPGGVPGGAPESLDDACRVRLLGEALDHIASQKEPWFTTCRRVAQLLAASGQPGLLRLSQVLGQPGRQASLAWARVGGQIAVVLQPHRRHPAAAAGLRQWRWSRGRLLGVLARIGGRQKKGEAA